MNHDILCGLIVELEDILDHFFFVFFNRTGFSAHVNHLENIIFGYFILFREL